jgi:aminoglycoside phosphotransferase (APT) family kinase protein
VHVDIQLARRLVAAQFPQWADLPLRPVGYTGRDNLIYQLGADLAVRLPSRALGASHVQREHQWLPVLAPRLPLPVPVPLGKGSPGEEYPWPWTVYQWLPGESAATEPVADLGQAAVELSQFVAALQGIDPAGGPDSEFRGVPLAGLDTAVREAVGRLPSVFDPAPVIAAWEAALATPAWQGVGVWMHGDLHPSNLLVDNGRVSAVIDFGLVAVGDPSCDLMVAWSFLDPPAREIFRNALEVDDETWARARGWALDFGLMCAVYSGGDPVLAGTGNRTLREVLTDHGHPVEFRHS